MPPSSRFFLEELEPRLMLSATVVEPPRLEAPAPAPPGSINEAEPNSPDNPQDVDPHFTSAGDTDTVQVLGQVATSHDEDAFSFTAEEGQLIVVSVANTGGQWEPYLQLFDAGGSLLKVAPGRFSYTFGRRALWAVVWLQEDLYAFALDWDAIQVAVSRFAQWAARPDGQIMVSVQQPDDPAPEDVFARRTLAPWLAGWSLVAHSADPQALRRAYSTRRTRRLLVISSAVLLLLVGAFLSIVLVRREMDLAKMKTTFAASVSHELRSPITQIRLKGESLMLGLAEDDADRQRHYEAIVREAERLSRLVDNVLDFAAIERGTKLYQLRPADLGQTLENAVESMRFSMESRGLELEVDIPSDLPAVRHDSDAVSQVVTNLLSNAAKYGGGWARVTVVLLPDGVQVEVADRGIGIDPVEAERIFDNFYRSDDPRARRLKGTGIGLAIVKYIMEAHGGTVMVKTMPGQGSIFQLFFPFTLEPSGVR